MTKAIGSEPKGSPEDVWFRHEREGATGEPREAFAARYFRESKIDDMLAFIKKHGPAAPDMFCLTHATEKNRFVMERQDGSSYGYFGASVQCAMAQGPGAQSMVVMLGGGDVIYNEMSSHQWTGAAAADKATKGYKKGSKVVAFDVRRKEQSQRCKVFDSEGEPKALFGQTGAELKIRGRVIAVGPPCAEVGLKPLQKCTIHGLSPLAGHPDLNGTVVTLVSSSSGHGKWVVLKADGSQFLAPSEALRPLVTR